MNDIEFERIAHRSADRVHEHAARIADSRRAFDLLVTAERPLEPTPPNRRPAGDDARRWRRSPWMPILIAASTIAALSGIVWLATGGDDESIIVTTEPPVPTAPGSIDGTTPDTADATVPGQLPDATAPRPATTLPAVGDDAPASPFAFDVPDEIGQPLARTELLTASVGSGDVDLGWEDCQECEPLRPWAPVVDSDGTIYVADVVNSRWRVVGLGASRVVPFPDGAVVAGSPVIGPDGLLYAPVAAALRQDSPRRVVAYDPASLEERDSYPVGPSVYDRLELVNGELLLGSVVVRTFDVPLGTPTVDVDHDAGIVTISLSGTQRQFRFPENWLVNGRDAVPIDDGSVVVRALAGVGTDDWELVLVRLFLDGTTSVGIVENDTTTNGAIQITSTGLVQLEGTTVVHYDLPGFTGADPLAGWTVPEFGEPDLADVPLLLPQQPVPGVMSAVRTEGADSVNESPRYSQVWVGAGADGGVDAIVQIDTRFEPRLIGTPSVDAQVPGWATAYFSSTTADVEILDLHGATRSMTVWTRGLDQADVVAAASSLTVDADGVGWTAPRLPDPDRWTLVHEGWYTGAAGRTLRQQAADQTVLEMWTMTGIPDTISAPGLVTATITLRSIAGRPALLFDEDGVRSAVTWSPMEDVVVVLGSYGPLEQLFEIAESVVPVDQPTWEAASTLDASPPDGCNGMFC